LKSLKEIRGFFTQYRWWVLGGLGLSLVFTLVFALLMRKVLLGYLIEWGGNEYLKMPLVVEVQELGWESARLSVGVKSLGIEFREVQAQWHLGDLGLEGTLQSFGESVEFPLGKVNNYRWDLELKTDSGKARYTGSFEGETVLLGDRSLSQVKLSLKLHHDEVTGTLSAKEGKDNWNVKYDGQIEKQGHKGFFSLEGSEISISGPVKGTEDPLHLTGIQWKILGKTPGWRRYLKDVEIQWDLTLEKTPRGTLTILPFRGPGIHLKKPWSCRWTGTLECGGEDSDGPLMMGRGELDGLSLGGLSFKVIPDDRKGEFSLNSLSGKIEDFGLSLGGVAGTGEMSPSGEIKGEISLWDLSDQEGLFYPQKAKITLEGTQSKLMIEGSLLDLLDEPWLPWKGYWSTDKGEIKAEHTWSFDDGADLSNLSELFSEAVEIKVGVLALGAKIKWGKTTLILQSDNLGDSCPHGGQISQGRVADEDKEKNHRY